MIFDDDYDPIAAADEESGENSASGSEPDPDTDDDTGEMVKEAFGRDPDPQMDNPQPVDIGEAIDKAEEAFRES